MDEMRFIDLESHEAAMNMAIDEAIMRTMEKGAAVPTLRIYRWKPSAVSIGTFQSMKEEVDIAYCQLYGIDFVRRITGGGAVYHDYEGEITYSIILPRDHRLAPKDIMQSYKVLCQGIVSALDYLGIKAEFRPVNDIVANGKKISGSAQTRRFSCLLQHGTTLLDLDVREMFSVLKVSKEKISDKMISDVKERVTSIRDILGDDVGIQNLRTALIEGFSKALRVELVPGALSQAEWELARKLAAEKYSNDEWNFKR
ncbi:MAG: lipoate--protein ligase family protein [Candidatus Thorarchaeota archaeon]